MKKTRILNYNGFSVYPGVRLIGKEKYQKLYHYTSFDTFIRIWLSKQLKFGEIDNVNDIIEVNHGWSTNNFDSIQIATRYHELRSAYKQISFTMDYDSFYKGCMSPMMWGIYGNKGRGVCIE